MFVSVERSHWIRVKHHEKLIAFIYSHIFTFGGCSLFTQAMFASAKCLCWIRVKGVRASQNMRNKCVSFPNNVAQTCFFKRVAQTLK